MNECPSIPAPAASRSDEGPTTFGTAALAAGPMPGAERTGDALLAIASLSRALDGNARLADVGALVWMLLSQLVPADAVALFLPDEHNDHVVVRYAGGLHADGLTGVARPMAMGIAGCVAVNRRAVLNADPGVDLGLRAAAAPALRACLVTPLVDSDALVAVLALYSKTVNGFTDDHLRLLEVLAPRLASALVDAAIADEDSRACAGDVPRALRLVHTS
ncbi:MAG: GAF domain-containing protein [Vicinamibacterales bacterium]